METIHTIGRRKSAVARIYMSKGKGNITINNREAKDYFTTGTLMYKLNQPFSLTENLNAFDLKVNVNGGGMTCLLYTSPSPRDATLSRMPSSA